MNGRLQALLSIVSLALCSAALGGCAVGPESEETSESALDALEGEQDRTADAEGEAEEHRVPAFDPVENKARTNAVRDTRSWGEGHPPPIPWHELTEGSGGAGENEPGSFDDSPHPPAPASPSDGR